MPPTLTVPTSPLVLADRLLTLAQDADQAGLRRPAEALLRLAMRVWREQPQPQG